MKYISILTLFSCLFLYSCIGVDEVDLSSPANQKIELDTTLTQNAQWSLNEKRALNSTYYNVYGQAEDAKVVWVSTDPSVLLIENDTARAVGSGTASIYATKGTLESDRQEITVVEGDIIISIEKAVLFVGKSETVSIEIENPFLSKDDVIWTSNKEEVVTIDENGVITTKSDGVALIFASINDVSSNSIEITVVDGDIIISTSKTEIFIDASETANISTESSNINTDNAVWTSSNEDVATVDENGVITAKAIGTTTISATVEEITSNSIEITVTKGNITISSSDTEFLVGKNATFNISADNPNLSTDNATWTSSNEDVATIDENGVITTKGVGTTTISATVEDLTSNSIEITVTELPSRTATFTTTTSYTTEGDVVLQQLEDGRLQLVFQENANISNGPSLYLMLANKTNPPFSIDKDGESVAVNATSAQLHPNRLTSSIKGVTTFDVPEGIEIDDYKYVVFYCTFGPVFGSAELK
ncbi:MAG: hypothetical protein GY827_02460 [Cytophagales bacterium]|nr:hypothetical protein [Cytophagales bacterium]